jgi:hypothetical protein
MPRRRTKWIAIGAAYGLALGFLLALIVGESDASFRTSAIEGAIFVGIPAAVFVVAAAPLWRRSRSRLWLAAAGILAFLTAVALAVGTWGVALPVSGGLVAVAIADFDRLLVLSGFSGSRRAVTFAIALLLAGALVGLMAPIAAVLALVGLVILVWKLVATRPRRTAGG